MNKGKKTLVSFLLASMMLSCIMFTGCATTGDGGTEQAVINYGVKIALAGAVYAVIKNNETYDAAFNQASLTITQMAWNAGNIRTDEVLTLLRADMEANEGITLEQQEKVILTLAAGLSMYDAFIRANPDGVVGRNQVLGALADGIDRAFLMGSVFDSGGEAEGSSFTL